MEIWSTLQPFVLSGVNWQQLTSGSSQGGVMHHFPFMWWLEPPQKEWMTHSSLSCFHKCCPDLAHLVLQCCPLGSKHDSFDSVYMVVMESDNCLCFVLSHWEWVMSQPTCSSLLFSTVLLGSKHRSSDSVYWSWWRVIATLVCVLSHWGMGCATSPANDLKCCWHQCC